MIDSGNLFGVRLWPPTRLTASVMVCFMLFGLALAIVICMAFGAIGQGEGIIALIMSAIGGLTTVATGFAESAAHGNGNGIPPAKRRKRRQRLQ